MSEHVTLLKLALLFIERQIIKFGQDLDWAKVKADVKTRIDDLVPGTYFDATAELIINVLIDGIALAFKNQSLPITAANLPQAANVAQSNLVRSLASRIVS